MSKDIEVGQVWVRRGGTGYGEDQITILEDGLDAESEWWDLQYGTGQRTSLDATYIRQEFEYQEEHPEEWEFTDLDEDTLYLREGTAHDQNVVFQTSYGNPVVLRPDDINDLIHWLTTHQAIHGSN